MQSVAAPFDVNQACRTYAAKLGSRNGAVLTNLVLTMQTEPNTDGYANDIVTAATLQMRDIVDGIVAQNQESVALNHKISYKADVNKSCYLYAARFSSRNGAQLSGITLVAQVEEGMV